MAKAEAAVDYINRCPPTKILVSGHVISLVVSPHHHSFSTAGHSPHGHSTAPVFAGCYFPCRLLEVPILGSEFGTDALGEKLMAALLHSFEAPLFPKKQIGVGTFLVGGPTGRHSHTPISPGENSH
jgi:hypothetical protein